MLILVHAVIRLTSHRSYGIDDADDRRIDRRRLLPSASPAALPSITTSTLSPTPAPTESIASSADAARLVIVERQRLHQQQLGALELPVLLGGDDRADDAGDLHGGLACYRYRPVRCQWSTIPTIARVGRRLGGIERKGGLAAADEEHVLADAGADRVERDQRAAGRLADGGERLQHQQLDAVRFASFMVATTSPMTRASCIGRSL